MGLQDELQAVRRPIATKLLRVVFSLYFIIASLVTVAHLMLEYAKVKGDAIDNLATVHHTFNSAIATSAWNLDERQLRPTLEGILSLPMIAGVELTPDDARESISLGNTGAPSHLSSDSWSSLFDSRSARFSRSFPVVYQPGDGSEPIKIGTLTLFSDRSTVLAKIEHSFYIILLNAIIKTVALYALFMWACRRFLSRPLTQFTQGLHRLDFRGDMENERIKLETAPDDEFGLLADAFNRLIQRINAFAAENRQLNVDLIVLNRDLEKRVRTRTLQLHEAQRKLLKAAHASGVSEVTSEILHNVGNIVTSIVIAINDMRDNLADDQHSKLMKVVSILEDKVARRDLDGMDEICEFLSVFASKAKNDMDSVREVLEGLQRFVIHLRHITETQKFNIQDVAYENEISIDTLLDDSLHLAGLKNNPDVNVVVEKQSPALPAFLSDEHKLIQVFVNLLLNARQAVMENRRKEKLVKVTVGVSRNVMGTADDILDIAIEDNGVGITTEHLQIIFRSGFTTKVTGSGLGLHNSANNLRTIGGEIECHSGGEMKGARFMVRLPLKRLKKVI